MKTLRNFRGELRWFTELGCRIASNDLLNDIRHALADYNKHQASKPKSKIINRKS